MKKIDFNFPILNLDGSEITTYVTKDGVANALASGSSDKPQRLMEIAKKIQADGEVELPSEDWLLIKNTITQSNLINLIKAQLLEKIGE